MGCIYIYVYIYIYISVKFSHPNSPTASPKPPGAWLFQQGQENMADATVAARARITEPVAEFPVPTVTHSHMAIWLFPKMGVPLNHPF